MPFRPSSWRVISTSAEGVVLINFGTAFVFLNNFCLNPNLSTILASKTKPELRLGLGSQYGFGFGWGFNNFLILGTIFQESMSFYLYKPILFSRMNKTTTLKIMNLGIDSEDLLRFSNEEHNEEPRQHIIDNLLRFSRSLEIRPSKMVGQIESVKN